MEKIKRVEPKKIKMPPLVDRSKMYDTLSFDNDTLPEKPSIIEHEDNQQNNSQSIR